MAKEITGKIKLQCPAGQATPAPPVGPALGAKGVNIAEFVKQFNDRTRDQMGMTIPVEITVYKDRSFEFILKSLRTLARSTPRFSSTRAATPSPSRIRPSNRCSVPM